MLLPSTGTGAARRLLGCTRSSILLAKDAPGLGALERELRDELGAAGIETLRTLRTDDLDGYEHFGFADGISQPAIEGYHDSSSTLHRIKPGEFLLGYANEYGLYTERPLLDAPDDPLARLPLDVEGRPAAIWGATVRIWCSASCARTCRCFAARSTRSLGVLTALRTRPSERG